MVPRNRAGFTLASGGRWPGRAALARGAGHLAVPEAPRSEDAAAARRQAEPDGARRRAVPDGKRRSRTACGTRSTAASSPTSRAARASSRRFTPWAAALFKERQDNQGRDRPSGTLSAEDDSRRDAGAELSVEDRADARAHDHPVRELHAVPPDLHRRPRLPRGARADLVRLFARQVGRRHVRGGVARLQRQELARRRRPPAQRGR